LQGLKPDVDLIGFIGTTEVMPCYKASKFTVEVGFSASWKAQRSKREHSFNYRRCTYAAASRLRT